MSRSASLPDWQVATAFARIIVGILFVMAGWWKVFELTPVAHAEQFFIGWFGDSWIPEPLLWALGLSIPFIELAAGVLLLLGWRLRETLAALAGLLIVTTYGHALKEALFNIDGHTFTRSVLIVFVLISPIGADRWTLDRWLERRRAHNE
ncbi:MAG: hypothetical protein COW59_11225 [Lysobacterales bacterium CG17_big_fil_post_rev_8_21_14_2_50_64_11]|nr:MAG: hypothetical protein COW59_11225 [Xanthomonadales bacterium CG17_big_fil_post_rev_8_21_14_2_50_64_11]PIX61271.1 MAG: hypothetical protein COZ47_02765 [Xanthomonadales bacterium CG_4_10_14_3_um_filter_64_11]